MPAFASFLFLGMVALPILLPGYAAYIGAYSAMGAAVLALLAFGWRERKLVFHPTALAILASFILVALTLPFTYQSGQDLLALVLLLPMLTSLALGVLARPAQWIVAPVVLALICTAGALVALAGGAYEHYVLGVYRPGLGNNPIHYGSLAAMVGCLALVGVVATKSLWRYAYFLGPVFALGSAAISDSRGPLVGVLAMAVVGTAVLTVWLWRDRFFRVALVGCLVIASAVLAFLAGSGNTRVTGLFDSALNIFRFTGGTDDIRAALYASALQVLADAPLVGVGLGQIMDAAEAMYPALVVGTGLENLHADWANFAAMAGALGLLAWALLIVAPLLLLLDRRVRRDRPTVLGAILLTTGQVTLGVSNATFGVLPQTVLYAVLLGYFLARARRLETSSISEAPNS